MLDKQTEEKLLECRPEEYKTSDKALARERSSPVACQSELSGKIPLATTAMAWKGSKCLQRENLMGSIKMKEKHTRRFNNTERVLAPTLLRSTEFPSSFFPRNFPKFPPILSKNKYETFERYNLCYKLQRLSIVSTLHRHVSP